VSRLDLATGMKWDKAGAKQWDPWDPARMDAACIDVAHCMDES
jgi:hypothetical protein